MVSGVARGALYASCVCVIACGVGCQRRHLRRGSRAVVVVAIDVTAAVVVSRRGISRWCNGVGCCQTLHDLLRGLGVVCMAVFARGCVCGQ
jgi:hypothetical protein